MRNSAAREGNSEATWWNDLESNLENNAEIWFLQNCSYKTKQAIIFEKLKPKFSKLPFLQSKTQFLKNVDTEQAILLE